MRRLEPWLAAATGVRLVERTDAMLALYPAGAAGYAAHCDNPDGDGRSQTHGDDGRLLACVLYLNDEAWTAADGGALRVFEKHVKDWTRDSPGAAVDVLPTAGTLVLFRADQTVHEVRPANRARAAMAIWFMGTYPPPDGLHPPTAAAGRTRPSPTFDSE